MVSPSAWVSLLLGLASPLVRGLPRAWLPEVPLLLPLAPVLAWGLLAG